MIVSKIISSVFISLLLAVGLWIVCYILVRNVYPKYSLRLRHHIFSLLVSIVTFVLCCSLSMVSSTIAGVEYSINYAKRLVLEKGVLTDQLASALLPNKGQHTTVNEVNDLITEALENHGELDKYLKYVDFSKVNIQKVANTLKIDNLSVREGSVQIVDFLFETYIREFTRTLHRIWWSLLLAIISIQLIYFGTMVYRAEKATARVGRGKAGSFVRKSKETHTYRRKQQNYYRRKYKK